MSIRNALLACAALAVTFVTSATPQTPRLLMQHARISWLGNGVHFFWQIAASPTDPSHLVACALRENAGTAHAIEALIYGSTDAGESWRILKTTSEFPLASEVSCAMTSDNVIYFAMSVGPDLPNPMRHEASVMYLWRSPDFGRTWKLSPHIPYSDAALLLVKKKAAGRDRVFDFADANGPSEDRYLTIFDNDATAIRKIHSWNSAPAGANDPLHCGTQPAEGRQFFDSAALPARPVACINGVTLMQPVDLENGLIGGLYIDWTLRQSSPVYLTFTRVTDDGRPLGSPAMVLKYTPSSIAKIRTLVRFANNSVAFGRIPGSRARRLYVAGTNVVNGHLRVFLVTSGDRGITWTRPQFIDDSSLRRRGNVEPLPTHTSIAVNKEGLLALSWSEFSGRCWRIAFSHDGGQHFDRSIAMNPCARNVPLMVSQALGGHVSVQNKSGLLFRVQDQQHIGFTINDFRKQFEFLLRGTYLTAAADGSFYALWSELGGQNDELHVTHIVFPGHESPLATQRKRAIANAVCCLVPNSRLVLDYTSYDYDPSTHEFEIGAVIVRQRGFGGKWPIIVRLKKITSVFGPIVAGNADNELQGPGAAWVFNGPGTNLPASSARGIVNLLPSDQYEYSEPRMLRFRLEGDLTHIPWESTNKPQISISQSNIVDTDLELLSTP